MSENTRPDSDYINCDPFSGDDSTVECQTVTIRKARKTFACYGLDGKSSHTIKPGERYRHEKALIDNCHWGEYRICLPCLDEYLDEW